MPLVNAKCTNCGGALKVDDTKEAAICEYCGSPFIVEKAINNYNYHITNNITAQNVIIAGKGEMEKERLLQNAKTQLGFNEITSARAIFVQVTNDYPDEFRGWYGLASIDTEEFKKVDVSALEFTTICGYMDRAIMTAHSGKKEEIQEEWKSYLSKHWSFLEEKKSELSKLNNKLNESKQSIERSNAIVYLNEVNRIKQTSNKGFFFTILFGVAGIASMIIIPMIEKSWDSFSVSLAILFFLIAVLSAVMSVAKKQDNGKTIINITFIALLLSFGITLFMGLVSSHDEKFKWILASIVILIISLIFKIVSSIHLKKTTITNTNINNTIASENTNIDNYNQIVSQTNQQINELKNRYNI